MLQALNPGRSSVLIVEDDPDSALFIARALEKFGIQNVFEAETAEEALAWLAKHPCDAALVDYNLPGMNGLRLLEHIHEANPDMRVIVVTGVRDERVAVSAMRLGAADYVCKDEMLTSGIIRSLQTTFREQRSSRASEQASALGETGDRLEAAQEAADWLIDSFAGDSGLYDTRRGGSYTPEYGAEDWSNVLDLFLRYMRGSFRQFPTPALSEEDALVRSFMERGSSPTEVAHVYRAALRSLVAEGDEVPFGPGLFLMRLFCRLVEQYQVKLSIDALGPNGSDAV